MTSLIVKAIQESIRTKIIPPSTSLVNSTTVWIRHVVSVEDSSVTVTEIIRERSVVSADGKGVTLIVVADTEEVVVGHEGLSRPGCHDDLQSAVPGFDEASNVIQSDPMISTSVAKSSTIIVQSQVERHISSDALLDDSVGVCPIIITSHRYICAI